MKKIIGFFETVQDISSKYIENIQFSHLTSQRESEKIENELFPDSSNNDLIEKEKEKEDGEVDEEEEEENMKWLKEYREQKKQIENKVNSLFYLNKFVRKYQICIPRSQEIFSLINEVNFMSVFTSKS